MSDPLLATLVAGHQAAPSWRLRLAFLRDWLRDGPQSGTASAAQLALVAIYLRLLGTGALRCEEDGGHHRPSHHAALSRELYALVAGRRGDDAALLRRRIVPWLPSFDAAYTRAEPLTRIRDIAHRNDIPQALKRELKTRLQNKLHRSADPGDLETSRELLARVEAAGAYPPAFVSELRRFHAELELFFGAADLAAQLAQASDAEPELAPLVQAVQQSMARGHAASPWTRLETALALRRALLTAGDETSERDRRRRLLELRLEDQTFAWTSELLPALFPAFEAEPPDYEGALRALTLLLDGLALGELPRTAALLPQLRALRARFDPRRLDPRQRPALLELKALLDRASELLDAHGTRLSALLGPRVAALGAALGVAPHVSETFVEGDLRGRLPFQLARLLERLARQVRRSAALPPWVPLAVGCAQGRLVSAATLAELQPRGDEALLARVQRAEGDETIPAAIHAILLAHDLPQLSHLGVRARQAGVVFACCDEPEAFAALAGLEGQSLQLEVDRTGLRYAPLREALAARSVRRPAPHPVPRPRDAGALPVLPDEVCVVTLDALQAAGSDAGLRARVGAKAWGAARLRALAGSGDFRAPDGVVLGAGSLEAQLAGDAARAARYRELLETLERIAEQDPAFDATLAALAACLADLPVPEALRTGVAAALGAETRLIVRSSSNVEDRADDAGAGLYDSVLAVTLAGLDEAVRSVWASLWSRRAVLARRLRGLPQRLARMAVLVQPLLPAELSFVLHTVDPSSDPSSDPSVDPSSEARDAYAELAVGLGEVLAAGRSGATPFRLRCRRGHSDDDAPRVETLAFASFDRALCVADDGALVERSVDYSTVEFACNATARESLGRRLAALADVLERELGLPQDVEGVWADGTLFVVQSRPQQGLAGAPDVADAADAPLQHHTRSDEVSMVATAQHAQQEQAIARGLPLFGLFDLQVRGDEALLALAQARFTAARLGAEIYAPNAEQLERRLRFAPQLSETGGLAMAHLPRDLDLREESTRTFVVRLARRATGRVRGLVLHDQRELETDADGYLRAVEALSRELAGLPEPPPPVLIEYAVALEPAVYLRCFERTRGLPHIGACLDIGHVGIHAARAHYAARHDGADVCALTAYDPRLPEVVEDLDTAVRTGLPAVLALLSGLARLELPLLHFHLHDGHPLWAQNPHGVSDHMSFLDSIPIPFAHAGAVTLPTLFGPRGLAAVVQAARAQQSPERLTMTLEIHPQAGQQALAAEHEQLFAHWDDRTNAERMNYWLTIIVRNAALLREGA